jgi:hypothetical protein
MDFLNMICPPGAGCAFTSGFGIAEILLWVLTFAIAYAALKHIINKRAAALIAIVMGFLVLMAIPSTLIAFIASMSTGLVALAIGLVAVLAVLSFTGTLNFALNKYATVLALVVLAIVALMFVGYGGLGLIGIAGLPVLSPGIILLILVGIAVLWTLSENLEPPKESKKQ